MSGDPEVWSAWARDVPFRAYGFFLQDRDHQLLQELADELDAPFEQIPGAVGRILRLLEDAERITIIIDQEDE